MSADWGGQARGRCLTTLSHSARCCSGSLLMVYSCAAHFGRFICRCFFFFSVPHKKRNILIVKAEPM